MTESNEENDCIIFNTISDLKKINVEVAGPVVLHAIGHTTRLKTRFERSSANNKTPESSDNEDEEEEIIEDDLDYLRSLDPKEWKNQDHYAVLGLKKYRYEASEDMIKRAYKQKILKHHPDKRKAMGEEIRADDDYFTCITRAWEQLGNTTKRRSYDSVDPFFSDDIPDEKDAKTKFYEIMNKAFEYNSRWSVKKPVPKLGNADTPRKTVERFYSFWYDFESWREYSYEDEEDKETGQDRDMRKWIEKKNKQTRAKRKKEEMSRIRTLVDTAYNLDPRIKQFHQDDKDRKTAAKRAKQEAARARQVEEDKLIKEAAEKEREEKLKRETEEKLKQSAAKQEREALKKALKKERKALRDICKNSAYFSNCPNESIKHMEFVEKFCETFKLNELESAVKSLHANGRDAFLKLISDTENNKEPTNHVDIINNSLQMKNNINNNNQQQQQNNKNNNFVWSEHDIQLLIKAVNLFPAGTVQRWEVVANFINQHTNNGIKRDPKDVLAKAKDLQSTDFSKSSLKESANKKAFDNFIAEKKCQDTVEEKMPAVTQRLDPPTTNNCNNKIDTTSINEITDEVSQIQIDQQQQAWTPTEQSLLEQALKTYSSTTGPEKWDLISACIPSRTKKDCMKRYKELVKLFKDKKAAQTGKQ